jgi:formylglycine-generating enzyme required for sulfatase activity
LPDYPEMVFIEGGRFMMGSNNDENEQPIHPVTISSFYMGKYEITNKQYCIFLNSFDNVNNVYNIDLSKEDGGIIQQNGELIVKPGFENLPVVYVNWYGTLAYCSWLSKETNKTYKLPTEAQWEYACRAGSTTDYYWGNKIDENYCWYSGNSNGINHEVGLKSPNAFGLYDMSGNVWEWCGDYLGESYVPFEQVDPTGAFTGGCSLRGGGVVDNYFYCRSAYRGILPSDFRMKQFPHSGFRIVMY